MEQNVILDGDPGDGEIVTEIRREEALLIAGALQNAIFNSANFSSIATDAKGVIQIFNVGAERMLGYAAAEVVNQITPADISDPHEVIARANALSAELATPITPGFEALVFKASRGIEDIYELTYIRKDGSRFPAVVSVTALRDAQSTIIGYLLIGTDNTARQQIEEERQRLDQRLRDQQFYTRSLIESNIDALMTTDPRGIITDVNKQTEALTGCTRDELIGAPFKNCFTDPERAEAGIRLVLGEQKVTDYELTARSRAGRETVVSYNATTFYDRDRRLLGVFAAARDVTERKRTKKALGASELRYRRLFETAKEGILILDAETGMVVEVNPFLITLLGFSHEQFLGKAIWELGFFKDVVANEANFAELKAKEYIRYENLPLETFDGQRIEVEFISSVYLVEDVRVIQCNVRDQTERRKAEAAVRASEERYRALFDYAPDGIVIADPRGYYIDANASSCRALGYTRGEFVRLHSSDIVAPAEVAHIEPALNALKTTVDYHREWQLRRKDGSVFPAEVIGTAMPDGNLLAMIRDITARKKTDEALRESEEHFRFLNDLSEAARPLADPERIMAVMARMLGQHLRASRCAYADVEKDGERFTILHDYTDGCASTVGRYQLSLFGARAVATLHRGQTLIIRNVEEELLPGEGADMFSAIGIKAIITCPLVKEGSLRAMMAVHQSTPREWTPGEIAIVKDVVERCWATIERRTVEEKVRHLNVGLERRVVERTAQLEAANKELEAFSYSVSHDLRAPLRAVDGFSQAVLEDFGPTLPAEGQRQLQVIRESAQRMGELIDDLLTFSRLSRLPLTMQTVMTDSLVRAILADMKAECAGRQVDIQIGNLPPCEGDPALLKQVWVNLLSNALKYSRRREAAVIEIGCVKTGGADAFFVRDNGTGFDMRYAGKLFGVFQRLHRAEDYEGTGVGLAIVQRIVQRHGGRVWAEAAVDRGATFHFTLTGETKP